MEMQAAIGDLELYGYCVIADAISAEQADRMTETYFNLHLDPANRA